MDQPESSKESRPTEIERKRQKGVVTLDALHKFDDIIDVRSPAEFADDHIPGAMSCPVLDDQQRIEIGTLYKQVSPFVAKKKGAAYVSANISKHLLAHFQDREKGWRPLVVCWRGGQRSGAMTTVLRSVGWDACQLEGGYKVFRTQVLERLEDLPKRFQFRVLTGPTGSAKTRILQAIGEQGGQVLDLETLACHKDSVLGRVPGEKQPSQKSFETAIWQALEKFDPQQPVFVEAESRKIGELRVPEALLANMHAGQSLKIQANVAARVDFLLKDYVYFCEQPAELISRLNTLRELRGNARVNSWVEWVKVGEFRALTEALLVEHYDALYAASQHRNYQAVDESCVFNATELNLAGVERVAADILRQPPLNQGK
jgi:tRNA 2-selenouridine synthase